MRTHPLFPQASKPASSQNPAPGSLHPRQLVLAAVALGIACLALPSSAQTPQSAPQATPAAQPATPSTAPQLREVPTSKQRPNYVMLDTPASFHSEEASETTAADKDASHVNFKLHGNWVIDIVNPDHTLAQHHVFENALLPSGAELLFYLLAGIITPGNPAIYLSGNTTSPCVPSGYKSGVSTCEIVLSTSTLPGYVDCVQQTTTNYCSATLTLGGQVVNGYQQVSLSGSITANQAGTIDKVSTSWSFCNSGTTPVACAATTNPQNVYGYLGLSGTNPSTISVTTGQSIQVTITYTIS